MSEIASTAHLLMTEFDHSDRVQLPNIKILRLTDFPA